MNDSTVTPQKLFDVFTPQELLEVYEKLKGGKKIIVIETESLKKESEQYG